MAKATTMRKAIQKLGADYTNIQTVRLGRLDGSTVLTDTTGMLWARQWNGKEIKVHNKALVSARFDLRVLVGVSRTQPGRWVILDEMDDYLVPAGGGVIAPHSDQHQWGGDDMVWVDRKQIIQLTCLAAGNFLVQVYGGIIRVGNTYVELETQVVDLSPYVVTAGALFTNIECSEAGELSVQQGDNFQAPTNANGSYIPIPSEGKILVCSVLMYESQPSIDNDEIVVPMPVERGGVEGQTYSAIRETNMLENDLIGFFSSRYANLRSISFNHFKHVLSSFFTMWGHPHKLQDTGVEALNGIATNYLGGDGLFHPLPITVNFFLSSDDSDITGYDTLTSTIPIAVESTASAAIPGADTVVQEYILAANSFDFVSAQVIHAHVHLAKTAGTKDITVHCHAFKRAAGGSETEICVSPETGIIAETNTPYDIDMTITEDVLFISTDRLVFKIFGSPSGGGSEPTLTIYLEGTTGSRIEAGVTLIGTGEGASFNDAEGDPADVTTGAADDGVSLYAARRDHVHHTEAGEGGTPMVYENLTSAIPADNDEYTLSGTPSGEVLVFWNSTLQTDYTVNVDVLALDFSPQSGDVLVAVYGLSGTLVEPKASPALRVYMNQNFTM